MTHRTLSLLTRRDLFAYTAAAAGLLGSARGARARGAPRVAIARHPSVLSDGGVQAEIVARMVDEAVCWATGIESADAAWASLFSSDEMVGIKPNGLGGFECSTAYEIIEHCVARLHGAGVRPERMVIWEDRPANLSGCGLAHGERAWGARVALIQDELSDPVTHGTVTDRYYAPLLNGIDAILNLPILKCHPICGVTLAMKNHYGSIADPASQHFDQCNTPLVDISDLPAIRDRTRLVVCDGTRSLIEGQAYGEAQYFPNIVMAATDVVAHDSVGRTIIEEERERRGLPALAAAGLEPRYLAMAAERGLGVADLAAIDYRVLDLE